MAISAVTAMGRVDLPASFIGTSQQQAKLGAMVLEITLGAGGDYTAGTGITYASIITAVQAAATSAPPTVPPQTSQITNVVSIQIMSARASGGAVYQIIAHNNVTNAGVQMWKFTNTPTIAEYTVTAGDIVRMLIVYL